jgi:O-methyltransferase involved in polyketide biosynthesis
MADLSVTALYTSGAWSWAQLPGTELLASKEAGRVFAVTNGALAVGGLFTGAPDLRCSLVQRHLIIDGLLRESGARHVLELAAGLAPRGVAVTADAGVTYTEVDRPAVVEHKRTLLARTEAGRAVLARPNLRFIGADLADAPLEPFVTAPAGQPLFVIAEGLLMYLEAEAQRAFWRRVRALFEGRPGTLVFDLVPAVEQGDGGVAGRLLGKLFKRATKGGAFVRDGRTRGDIAGELAALGFTAEHLEPAAVLDRFNLPHGDVRTQQLVWSATLSP